MGAVNAAIDACAKGRQLWCSLSAGSIFSWAMGFRPRGLDFSGFMRMALPHKRLQPSGYFTLHRLQAFPGRLQN